MFTGEPGRWRSVYTYAGRGTGSVELAEEKWDAWTRKTIKMTEAGTRELKEINKIGLRREIRCGRT